ncbi:MAG TPA: hypothetical protein DHW22_08920 [Planctomycetaceae bacterium]|nr:hypothetical protein [Planctomycetaceae bacterium]
MSILLFQHGYQACVFAHLKFLETHPSPPSFLACKLLKFKWGVWILAPSLASREKIFRGGDPGHNITDYAKEIGAGLIVMPSHGRTRLKRMLIGSVAERVVRLAHCPV